MEGYDAKSICSSMPDLTSITPAQQNFSNVSGGGFVEVVPQTQVVLTEASGGIFILTGFGGEERSKDMMRRSLRSDLNLCTATRVSTAKL